MTSLCDACSNWIACSSCFVNTFWQKQVVVYDKIRYGERTFWIFFLSYILGNLTMDKRSPIYPSISIYYVKLACNFFVTLLTLWSLFQNNFLFVLKRLCDDATKVRVLPSPVENEFLFCKLKIYSIKVSKLYYLLR